MHVGPGARMRFNKFHGAGAGNLGTGPPTGNVPSHFREVTPKKRGKKKKKGKPNACARTNSRPVIPGYAYMSTTGSSDTATKTTTTSTVAPVPSGIIITVLVWIPPRTNLLLAGSLPLLWLPLPPCRSAALGIRSSLRL
eukprot:1048181-Rhodomonas_salina.2